MIHKLLGLHTPLPARDHKEEHRTSTTLELFYDLVIVIAIAFTAEAFHHSIEVVGMTPAEAIKEIHKVTEGLT